MENKVRTKSGRGSEITLSEVIYSDEALIDSLDSQLRHGTVETEQMDHTKHNTTTAGSGTGFLPNEAAETAARRGTLICCASVDRLAQAYAAGCREPEEYSEMLGVPVRTCAGALALLREMFGSQVIRIGGWICTLDPFSALETAPEEMESFCLTPST